MEIRRRDFNLICKLAKFADEFGEGTFASNAKFAVGKDVLLKYVP
jgi:hypothetical protein